MDLPKREIKNIFYDDEARKKTRTGALVMYKTVGSTYGPAGLNVILGMPYGDATLTRDGVTVAKRVVLRDRAEDDAAQILRQASEKTNRSAGDGTTATVELGYYLFDGGFSQTRAHWLTKLLAYIVVKLATRLNSRILARYSTRLATRFDSMLIKRQIVDDSKKVIEFLMKQSVDAKDHLKEVATVSAGDPAIGALVADTLEEVGTSGGITIREQNYPTIDVEKVGGYYFDKGFFALNQMVEFVKPQIFVSQKQISENADIIPIISKVLQSTNHNLVIIGDVRINSDAMNTLLLNIQKSETFKAVVIPPPAFNDEGLLFMQDISLYVGSKLFMNGDDPETVKDSTNSEGKVVPSPYFGTAERVQITPERAIIFGGAGSDEDIEIRAKEIQEAISKEKGSHRKDNLEQRYSKLTGKIAIVNVGGSTPTEMEELRYRVEDAIEATKSAMADGVLPGGGTMLVRAAQLNISPVFKRALLNTFRKLMTNAAEPADYRMKQVRNAPTGYGFDLRNMTEDPVDLSVSGIWDATRSVVQTVENATSAAGSLLTVGAIVDPIDQDDNEVA